MDLGDLFGPEPLVTDLKSEDRWQAIDELVTALAAAKKIKATDRDTIALSVRRRESAMSTGIGFGIAIPHARTDLVSVVTAAVGRSRKGIQFEAVDGKPVDVVILYLVPLGEIQKHLHTLASIAKVLHRDDFRDGLRRRFSG
jgi:mannitol/fructose-specific phosphotransferase system IIA component (Ntr-type)